MKSLIPAVILLSCCILGLAQAPSPSTPAQEITLNEQTRRDVIETVLLVNSSLAQSPGLAAKMDEYMNAAAKQGFAGAVLIARDGHVLFSRGYGLANRELEVPNTPQTKFRIGSLTKQFTAAAILLLEERGKLSVQDSLCRYFDDCPKAWNEVTLHHLLTHTSGIPSYTDSREYITQRILPITVMGKIDQFKDLPLQFKPGEQWKYSNSGYFLLGYVIERAAGESYESFLRKNIFDSLRLANTGYDHHAAILKNRAAGYSRGLKGVVNARYLDMGHPYAAGALYSTVEDLYAWCEALFSSRLLSAKSLEVMTTPFKGDYAYGLFLTRVFNRRLIYHGAGINGFNANFARFPEEKITVVVLRNTDFGEPSPDTIADALAAILLGEKYDLPSGK